MNSEFDPDIKCTPEETEYRLSFCMTCEKSNHVDIPKCTECNCTLSMIGTWKFKLCPIGKW